MTLTLQRDARWALLAVAFLIYLPTLNFDFAYDDVHGLPRAVNYSTASFDRLLTEWTFDLQAGQSPGAYHLVNVLIHLANGLGLIWLLTRDARGPAIPVALLAAAIFLLHPLQVESVAYISARADLLVVSGFLIALAGLTGGGWRRRLLLLAGTLIMIAAKPAGLLALLPLAVVLGLALEIPAAVGVAGLAVAAAALGLARAGLSWDAGGWAPQSWFAVQVFSVASYLLQVILPIRLTADPAPWLAAPTVALEVFAVVALGWAGLGILTRAWGLVVLVAWVGLSVGWRVILPHTETFGGPGDGYFLMLGVSVWIALVIRVHLWPPAHAREDDEIDEVIHRG